jgi:hypothetical protein
VAVCWAIGEGGARSGRALAIPWRGRLTPVRFIENCLNSRTALTQVPLVPDQGPVEQLAAAGPHPSLHNRGHPRHQDPCPARR